MNTKLKLIGGAVLVVTAFILVSYLIQTNLEFFKNYLDQGFISMAIYVLLIFFQLF